MLAKRERHTRAQLTTLTLRRDLSTTYNRLGTLKYLTAKAFPVEGRRLSAVTSGKHEKRAVYRNRLRRRIYDAFRRSPATLSGILYVSKQSYALTSKEITELATQLFEKASR